MGLTREEIDGCVDLYLARIRARDAQQAKRCELEVQLKNSGSCLTIEYQLFERMHLRQECQEFLRRLIVPNDGTLPDDDSLSNDAGCDSGSESTSKIVRDAARDAERDASHKAPGDIARDDISQPASQGPNQLANQGLDRQGQLSCIFYHHWREQRRQ